MKATVIKATVNLIVKYRVYYGGELLASFNTEQQARAFAKFIEEQ